jgi:hypothetical protein
MRPGTLKAYAFGVFTGSLVTAGLTIWAAPANADVTDATVDLYSDAVCSVLADHFSFDGIIGIGQSLSTEYGFTGYEAGEIIAASVITNCPQFIPLIKAFGTTYSASAKTKVV